MKKLVSLGLTLVMCCCLTLSACAVQAEDAPKASDDPESTVDTFVGSGEGSANTDVETFANSAGSTTVTDSKGNTYTLSNPILYTISKEQIRACLKNVETPSWGILFPPCGVNFP